MNGIIIRHPYRGHFQIDGSHKKWKWLEVGTDNIAKTERQPWLKYHIHQSKVNTQFSIIIGQYLEVLLCHVRYLICDSNIHSLMLLHTVIMWPYTMNIFNVSAKHTSLCYSLQHSNSDSYYIMAMTGPYVAIPSNSFPVKKPIIWCYHH